MFYFFVIQVYVLKKQHVKEQILTSTQGTVYYSSIVYL